jgi:hypothetical protein
MKKSILVIAVAMMLVLSQCKKNEIVKNNNGITPVTAMQQGPDIERILDFNKAVQAHRQNPDLRTREVVDIEEAADDIADLFNATYTEPTAYYIATESHQFSINLPLTADGKVLVDDVVAAYEQAVAEARKAYHGSALANKGYRRLMVTFDMQRDGEVSLDFDGQYGSKNDQPQHQTPHIDGPFSVGDDWLCGGQYIGKCDDPSIPGSADEKLKEQLYLKINDELPTAPEGYRMVFVRNREYEFSGPKYHGIYYTEDLDDTCIGWMYLNDYYAGEINNIYRILPDEKEFSLNAIYSFGRYYVESAIVYYEGQQHEPYYHKHVTNVRYGVLDYVNDDVIGFDDL